MALSVTRGLGSEVSISNFDGARERKSPDRHPRDMRLFGMRGSRVKRTGGSCTSDFDDTAEAVDIGFAWKTERAECYAVVPSVSAFKKEALLGQPFLGQRLLC